MTVGMIRYNLHILSINRAEVAENTIPAPRSFVVVVLQRSIPVFNFHFRGVKEHVRSNVAAGHFTAVGARAEVAAWFGEEVFCCDGDTDATAETAACHAIGGKT